MTPIRVSVCVVSWHRPEALRRCITAIRQLRYGAFEVVVVADPAGLAALPDGMPIKRIAAQDANISVARNQAIAASAGGVVAFIDDDAVPEPTWLRALISPFAEPDIAYSGGYVRGRNGISWQWRGRCVNRLGETRPLAPETPLPEGFALKTEGTNMAIRRDVLAALGGFDPAFRFYLDETDLNLRLHAAGHRGALVPAAEVHHGFAASARRRRDRVPTDLHQIGASWAAFLRKHAPAGQVRARLEEVRAEEERRLVRHLIAGGLEPRDVRRLRASFAAGVAEGRARPVGTAAVFPDSGDFMCVSEQRARSSWLTCGFFDRRDTYRAAETRARSGEIVTVFNLSPTALFHAVSYRPEGFWVQKGGVFGKSERDQPLFRYWRRKARVLSEVERVQIARDIA